MARADWWYRRLPLHVQAHTPAGKEGREVISIRQTLRLLLTPSCCDYLSRNLEQLWACGGRHSLRQARDEALSGGTLFTTGSATFYPRAGQGFSFIPWASISLGAAQYLSILPLWCNGLENGFWVSLNSGSNVSLDFDLEQIFSPIWASVPSSAKWGRQTHAPEVLVSREYYGWHTVGTQSTSTIIIWIHLTTTPCQYQDDF